LCLLARGNKKTSYATEHRYIHSRSRHYMEDTGQLNPSAFSISTSLHNNRFYSDEVCSRFTGYQKISDYYKHLIPAFPTSITALSWKFYFLVNLMTFQQSATFGTYTGLKIYNKKGITREMTSHKS